MILSRLICTTTKALRVQSNSCPQNEHGRSSHLQMLNHPYPQQDISAKQIFPKGEADSNV
jgi:hypothetical protein